jgi:hypothetical protein
MAAACNETEHVAACNAHSAKGHSLGLVGNIEGTSLCVSLPNEQVKESSAAPEEQSIGVNCRCCRIASRSSNLVPLVRSALTFSDDISTDHSFGCPLYDCCGTRWCPAIRCLLKAMLDISITTTLAIGHEDFRQLTRCISGLLGTANA